MQDQLGARSWIYDTNPAAGVPYAYTQGIIDIAKEDCEHVPLSTEDGFDRLINYEAEFCGLTWSLDPGVKAIQRASYAQIFKDFQNTPTVHCGGSKWELYPISLMMAHDKVAFTHHDLGQTIDDKEQLTASLAIGYMMIYRRGPDIEEDEMKWLRWLDLIQKHICARYIDKKLIDFEHLEEGITRSTFENIVVTANWGDGDYEVSPGCVIAPKGFYVKSTTEDLVAGVFMEFNGIKYTEETILLKDAGETWVAPSGESPVRVPA